MKKEELNTILVNHKHWINEDCEGWENMRANLTKADLRGADLIEADLTEANLSGVKNFRLFLTCARIVEVSLDTRKHVVI